MSKWYIGQKVVCVNDGWKPFAIKDLFKPPHGGDPKLNEVCTITEIVFHSDCTFFGLQGYSALYCEIHRKKNTWNFRPLEDHKGMETLRAILNPINHKLHEDA